jgi:hypothetical protein
MGIPLPRVFGRRRNLHLGRQWAKRIDDIEHFEPYIMDHQRYLYDSIQIGDIRDLAPHVDEYDHIVTGDVIEHMD